MKRILYTLPLGLALMTPVFMSAAPAPQDHRYYDPSHRDYHEWNDGENRAWRRYWEDRHRHYVEWDRASESQRRAYWRWRHDHPDSVLFQVNVR